MINLDASRTQNAIPATTPHTIITAAASPPSPPGCAKSGVTLGGGFRAGVFHTSVLSGSEAIVAEELQSTLAYSVSR